MFSVSPSSDTSPFAEYAIWLVTIVLVAFGFRYAKDLIAFVLEKLYEFFIENNRLA